jgi:RNA polymerase sigma-70 factor, ECF subfamily
MLVWATADSRAYGSRKLGSETQENTFGGNYCFVMTGTDVGGLRSGQIAIVQEDEGATLDWALVLAEHGRWLRTVVRARLGEDQGVDEVIQNVSLAVVAQRSPLNDHERLGAWLYQLAVRQAMLHRRKHGRQRKLIDRYSRVEASESFERNDSDPLCWLLLAERDQLVREAVDRLSDSDRELFLLKYTEGWSCRQLAERVGQSESAIEARLHRARLRLRLWLADAVEDPNR